MESDLNFKATELRLGLPGRDECEETVKSTPKNNKRASSESNIRSEIASSATETHPAPKAQIVGWPPVRSYRKKHSESEPGIYVKVSMDGAPYLRKIDLKIYDGYSQLLQALENMFKLSIGDYSEREGYKGSEYSPAYEDKDGDLMLVGDVPWDMFKSSCKKLRIMKGSEAKGLGFCA
ncbi:auxin-induced protein 22D [Dorcoceras hygrometricum]|uniref:Auxin-responsive protein n=1 Tax=Dorcoceras hygrometricum TaxID=472368 RepID=A0A2Z7DHX4_9LAMI|nr:auxin-induced protein 22D [Dorcoceras hygrometricum]